MATLAQTRGRAGEVAVDDNLPLPADFGERTGHELAEFHQLEEMMAAFGKGEAEAMFSPVGLLPLFEDAYDVGYRVVGQATVGPERKRTLTSTLMVPVDAPERTPEEVLAGRLGRVNRFCTTSFWAPLVALLDRPPPTTEPTFVDCAGFVDMVGSVLDGRSDAAMVWDVILARNPDLARRLRPVLAVDTLAAPVVVVREDAGEAATRMAAALTGYRVHDPGTFFSGLDAPDVDGIARFRRAIDEVRGRFRISSAD